MSLTLRHSAALAGSGGQTVTPTPIPSAQSVPAPTLRLQIRPASVASAESVPSPSLRLVVAPSSIGSAAAVGAPELYVEGVLAPSSIASAQAVPSPTLVPGAALLVVTSTASAGSVPAPSVRSVLRPSSIGSAAAIPAPTVSPGAATVSPSSIPSAAAFGLPHLRMMIAPTSVPSAAAVGVPSLRLRLVVASTPSGLVIPGPTLTPGVATVSPSSIGSAESVPTIVLTITLDPSVRAGRGGIAPTARYELMMVARLPQSSGPPVLLDVDPIDWLTIRWADVLSRPQELSLSCLEAGLTDPVLQRLRDPAREATELHLYRDGALMFAGPLITGSRRGATITLEARGLLTYLRWMYVARQNLIAAQQDQFAIVGSMVDQWQQMTFGHYGIDTSSLGVSGVLRDGTWLADELHNIAQRVEDLGERRRGFDAEVDPATRKLQLWHPLKGVDRSQGDEAVVFDQRNITSDDVMFSVAPGDLASYAIGTGTSVGADTTLMAEAENAELMATFGRAGVAAQWHDVSEQATLDEHVGGILDARDQTLWVPGPNVRVDPDSDLNRYDVGDWVQFNAGGLIGVSGAFRVRSRTIDVDSQGRESVSLQFV